MRLLTLAFLCGVSLAATATAGAQNRKDLHLNVKPRSWLDAGTNVPVGSMQNYVNDTQYSSQPSYFGGGSRGFLSGRPSSGGIPVMFPTGW